MTRIAASKGHIYRELLERPRQNPTTCAGQQHVHVLLHAKRNVHPHDAEQLHQVITTTAVHAWFKLMVRALAYITSLLQSPTGAMVFYAA
jgi:hypothetical protein